MHWLKMLQDVFAEKDLSIPVTPSAKQQNPICLSTSRDLEISEKHSRMTESTTIYWRKEVKRAFII